ncbi:NAD dependent epimerase/dehydratase [Saccharata proteae CBS 121410]|uniref:NAD dependent epimerase/dehydratase n=1 Tax=Saccharata proteae CBS 121410 TaxID=1314787 RepID=A0A9P4I252_9PEZI|nr:NAD dependent epimerase/dehydratase [Saccharata proteae CBS 121410]
MKHPSYVLVTGATGFVGAHVVDELLSRGIKVRGTARSMEKASAMLVKRSQYQDRLDFVHIEDFASNASLEQAVDGVDAVVHVASPFKYDVSNNEQELVLPAINGVKAILAACAKSPRIERVVLTSSTVRLVDMEKLDNPESIFTANDWIPLTYEEAIAPSASPFVAYCGSKKFAELEAWDFMKREKPPFDLVSLCPPLIFGPVAHPVSSPEQLNESNATMWKAVTGTEPFPPTILPIWIDVRDLAKAHVEALLRPEAGGKQYTVASPEKYTYGLAAHIAKEHFPQRHLSVPEGITRDIPVCGQIEWKMAASELELEFRPFEKSIVDFVRQVDGLPGLAGSSRV